MRQEARTKPNPPDLYKSPKVVISGVDGDKNSWVWRKTVDKVHHHITGLDVDLVGLGGRYKEGNKRLILMKLKTAWDCRIIVSNARQLAE